MRADRTEQHNLAAEHPEQVKELTAKWKAWAERTKVLPWVWKPEYKTADGKPGAE